VGSGAGRRHPRREHQALREAAIAGDIDACVALEQQHVRRTLRLVSAAARSSGESRARDQRSDV